mmetsp:Transcript_40368/g.93627  ORF Transcript_40368/g.93627 Transcript_40368/m.93627 type:complete len:216 (-) Transcript_40368:274-921(-)
MWTARRPVSWTPSASSLWTLTAPLKMPGWSLKLLEEVFWMRRRFCPSCRGWAWSSSSPRSCSSCSSPGMASAPWPRRASKRSSLACHPQNSGVSGPRGKWTRRLNHNLRRRRRQIPASHLGLLQGQQPRELGRCLRRTPAPQLHLLPRKKLGWSRRDSRGRQERPSLRVNSLARKKRLETRRRGKAELMLQLQRAWMLILDRQQAMSPSKQCIPL